MHAVAPESGWSDKKRAGMSNNARKDEDYEEVYMSITAFYFSINLMQLTVKAVRTFKALLPFYFPT